MKLLSGFVLLLIFTGSVKAQSDPLKKYWTGDYKGAIELYQKELVEKPSAYVHSMLGKCYLKLDSLQKAKEKFLEAMAANVKDNSDSKSLIQFDCHSYLASIYFEDKDYRKALDYSKLALISFKNRKVDDVGVGFPFLNAAQQAHCDFELGLIDSAVQVLTPFVFFNHEDLSKFGYYSLPGYTKADSIREDTVLRFYLSLLQRTFTNKQIKHEFKMAEKHFAFNIKTSAEDKFGYTWKNFKASTKIFGARILFFGKGFGIPKESLATYKPEPFPDKTYQLDQYRQSPINKMIQALPD